MGSTLAQLRTRLRVQGNDLCHQGVADSGSGIALVKDADVLTQADNYWQGALCTIETTTDDGAPVGETREVTSSAQTATTITTLSFSAAVGAGDTFTLADFSDTQLKNLLNTALLELSEHKPYKTTTTLSIVAGTKLYDAPDDALRIARIAYINETTQEEREYAFSLDAFQDKVELAAYPVESKTATVWYTKRHTAFTTADSTTTADSEDERLLLIHARRAMCLTRLSKTAMQVRYQIGNLMEDFSSAAKALQAEYGVLDTAWHEGTHSAFLGFTTHGTPSGDNWPLPSAFRWRTT